MTADRLDIPISLPTSGATILAAGAELKGGLCLLRDGVATLVGPFGDLSEPDAYRAFLAEAGRLLEEADVEAIACDLHPEYAATRWARSTGKPLVPVQHHHAHAVSGLVENGLAGPAVAVVCDGTGYGTDGAIWGGEVLHCSADAFERAGHLRPWPLPGGDAAAIETWRPAVGLLHETFGPDWPGEADALFARVDADALTAVRSQLASPTARVVRTTSLGRLFDGVAFLLGLCDRNDTEAAAPIAVQAAADRARDAGQAAFLQVPRRGECLDWRPMIRHLVAGAAQPDAAALGFHRAVAQAFAESAAAAAVSEDDADDLPVVLSGGCFVNEIFRSMVVAALTAMDLTVLQHKQLSCGDAGVPLGQALVADSQRNASCA